MVIRFWEERKEDDVNVRVTLCGSCGSSADTSDMCMHSSSQLDTISLRNAEEVPWFADSKRLRWLCVRSLYEIGCLLPTKFSLQDSGLVLWLWD